MATTEIAATPEINAEVMAQLVDMAGYVVGNWTTGFMWRAEATQEDFWQDPTNPKWFAADCSTAGAMYADYDYAFRELMRPDHRAAMATEFEKCNQHRAAHYGEQHCDAMPVDVEAAIKVANEVLDAVAREQDADRLLEAAFDDNGFWGEFIGEILVFFETGEISDLS
jgi:hypothetical protein